MKANWSWLVAVTVILGLAVAVIASWVDKRGPAVEETALVAQMPAEFLSRTVASMPRAVQYWVASDAVHVDSDGSVFLKGGASYQGHFTQGTPIKVTRNDKFYIGLGRCPGILFEKEAREYGVLYFHVAEVRQ